MVEPSFCYKVTVTALIWRSQYIQLNVKYGEIGRHNRLKIRRWKIPNLRYQPSNFFSKYDCGPLGIITTVDTSGHWAYSLNFSSPFGSMRPLIVLKMNGMTSKVVKRTNTVATTSAIFFSPSSDLTMTNIMNVRTILKTTLEINALSFGGGSNLSGDTAMSFWTPIISPCTFRSSDDRPVCMI